MGLKSKPAMVVESEVRLRGGDEKSAASKGALIDAKSMAEYRKEFENHRLQNRHATETEILHHVREYIKRRIDGIVDDACKKRIMDLTTVALSVASSTLIPFSGVAVVVAATVMQCLNFSVTLGLIPLLNVRSTSDLASMSSQIGNSIKRASKSSLMAGVETAVLEILKKLGLGDWLWADILRDILVDMVGDSAMDAAWIMTPLLAAPKYMMHRHLIKKMYRKLGDKAHVVHQTWTEQNCVQIEAQTTVVAQVQVDAYGNVQGAYVQTQEVTATHAGAQMSQTNAYFQPQNGGTGLAQVSQTNAYFQPEKGGAGELQVSQTDAYFQPENGGVGEVQVSQTTAYFHPENGGAGQAEVSGTNAHFRQQSGSAGEVEVSQTHAFLQSPIQPPFQPPLGGTVQAGVSQTNAYVKRQSGGVEQVSQTSAYFQPQSAGASPAEVSQPNPFFQQQAPQQKPWQPSTQPPYTKPTPSMVPDYQQGQPLQPASNSNMLAKKNPTLIMGYSPPKNSSFFQPQVQPQGTQVVGHMATANSSYFQSQFQAGGGFFQAAAAAQTYSPPPNPTYFQQPYGAQQTRPVHSQPQWNPPQGNPYVQMGDYNKPQAAPGSSTPGQPQYNPYVQMGDYNKPQVPPASSTPGQPQFNPYVQMGEYNNPQAAPASSISGNTPYPPNFQTGDYNKMQAPIAYPQAGNPQPCAGHHAAAPLPQDLWYQR